MSYQAWRRWRSCGRKVAHPSELVATNVATALAWRDGRVLEPYRCGWCSTADHPVWHVGRSKEAA